MQRFVEEIEMRKVALTGKNIFKLTRKLILAVSDPNMVEVFYETLIWSFLWQFSGTVVTFEIALLDRVRFDESKRLKCEIAF